MSLVKYVAIYRSDTTGPAEQGYQGICVGLFAEIDPALNEARSLLREGYHVSIDHGAMSEEEWAQLEEVPDDFVATSAMAVQP